MSERESPTPADAPPASPLRQRGTGTIPSMDLQRVLQAGETRTVPASALPAETPPRSVWDGPLSRELVDAALTRAEQAEAAKKQAEAERDLALAASDGSVSAEHITEVFERALERLSEAIARKARERIATIEAERDALKAELATAVRLAREATNGWAAHASHNREHDEISRLHLAISALNVPVPPTEAP